MNGREWVITFSLYRPESVRVSPAILLSSIPSTKYLIVNTQPPSPPIRGTYKMWLNGAPISVWDSSSSSWKTDISYDST